MFLHPYANMLPIAVRSLNSFLYSNLCCVAEQWLCVICQRADCKRNHISCCLPYHQHMSSQAPHPLVDTLALLGSTISAFDSTAAHFAHFCHQCYHALLLKLVSIWGVTDDMPNFPLVSQVHQELCKSVFLLLQQQNDPDFPAFMTDLHQFCIIM